MASKKYANKVGIMHESNGQHTSWQSLIPTSFFTLQLDSAWGSSYNMPQVHSLYGQFVANMI